MEKIPKIQPPKTVTVIRSKGARVKDPIRFPKVAGVTEDKFTDDYLKMISSMTKMMQIELLNQVRK